jgi:hypothetical protein
MDTRPTSLPGTATTPGRMNNSCATSAATKATYLTTTGRGGRTTCPSLLSSTEAILVSAETESISQEGTTHVWVTSPDATSSSSPAVVEVASRVAR